MRVFKKTWKKQGGSIRVRRRKELRYEGLEHRTLLTAVSDVAGPIPLDTPDVGAPYIETDGSDVDTGLLYVDAGADDAGAAQVGFGKPAGQDLAIGKALEDDPGGDSFIFTKRVDKVMMHIGRLRPLSVPDFTFKVGNQYDSPGNDKYDSPGDDTYDSPGDDTFKIGNRWDSPGDELGSSLAVGNFKGDGYADLAIGVPGEDEYDSPGDDTMVPSDWLPSLTYTLGNWTNFS